MTASDGPTAEPMVAHTHLIEGAVGLGSVHEERGRLVEHGRPLAGSVSEC
jgi:hypothetical protein